MFNLIIKFERWKFNKEYGVWVSTEGKVKDRYKRILPIRINKGGYCTVQTEKGFKYIHRLVMLTYYPIADSENLTVDHLNHNKRDNSLKNLEWVTKKENFRRAERDRLNCTQNKEVEVEAEKLKQNVIQYNENQNWYVVNGLHISEEDLIEFIQYNRRVDRSSVIGNLNKTKDGPITYCGLSIEKD